MMEIFKKAEIYGSLASVYHGSQRSPEEFKEFWKSGNFAPGLGSGSMYGPGIYCVYEKAGSKTGEGEYGPYIYKFIVNISDYLILDEAVFNKVHPRDANLPYNEKLKLQFKKFKIGLNEEIPNVQPVFTSYIAEIIQDNGIHQGLIFTGRQDGNVCVIFNPYSARMVGYSSGGNEVRFGMEEIKENNVTREPLKREGYTEEERWRYLANTYAKNKLDSFFYYFEKINAILGEEEAKRVALSAAQNLAKNDIYHFFYYFDKIQAALGEADMKRFYIPIAQDLIKKQAWVFFNYFDKTQAALGEAEVKELVLSEVKNFPEDNAYYFFYYFDKIKMALGPAGAKTFALPIIRSLAENNPVTFFDDFDKIKAVLGDADMKGLILSAAENFPKKDPIRLFLYLDKIRNVLEADKIKDIAYDAAQNLAENNPVDFFELLGEIQAALGEEEASRLEEIAKLKEASSKQKRFNKIARYLRLVKIS